MPLHSIGRPKFGSVTKKLTGLTVGLPVEVVPRAPAGYARFVGDGVGLSLFSLPNCFLVRNTLDSVDELDVLTFRLLLNRPSVPEVIEVARASIPPGLPVPPGFSELSKFILILCYKGDESFMLELLPGSVSTECEVSETHNDFPSQIIEVGRVKLPVVPEIPGLLTPPIVDLNEILALVAAQGAVIVPDPTLGRTNVPLLRGCFGLGPCFFTNEGDADATVMIVIKNPDGSTYMRIPSIVPAHGQGLCDAAFATVEPGQTIVAASNVESVTAIMTQIEIGRGES